jgi:DNA helicase-2/ATP-dependent DNA helicase PcrA
LVRAAWQMRAFEERFLMLRIPYKVIGGPRFFERAEVKHALAYLRLMDNPHEDNAFLRVVNFPTRGIGARSIEQLSDLAKARRCSLYEAASSLDGKAGTSVRGFIQMIESLRFETQGLPLHEMVKAMLERSGLVRHFETEKEGRERVENLRELVNAAAAFVADEGLVLDAPANIGVTGATIDESGEIFSSPLSMFLAHASLEAGDNQASEGQDAVQLMTIHSAKGLEFNVVFITGLEEGLFPHENSLTELDGLEEERRLMYVAITRAKHTLTYLDINNATTNTNSDNYSDEYADTNSNADCNNNCDTNGDTNTNKSTI